MYTPHPDSNRLTAALPRNLVDATKHQFQLNFEVLSQMRSLISELADVAGEYRPDFVPFFATGGIPFVFPMMHILERRNQHEFVDGNHFHMFPGLTWRGRIDNLSSSEFFIREFGMILRATRNLGRPIRVLVIDTTNSGNAINVAVRALEGASQAAAVSPQHPLEIQVFGIVDASHAANRNPRGGTVAFETPVGIRHLTLPSEWIAHDVIRDGQPLPMRRVDELPGLSLILRYRFIEEIPTEDRAELLGAHARQGILGVETDRNAGRIVIAYSNGIRQTQTGYNSPGHRLLSLLYSDQNSMPWQLMKKCHALPPLTPEEEARCEEANFYSEGGLRFVELNGMDVAEAVEGLRQMNRLLNSAEIYWLSRLRPLPLDLLPKVKASARANSTTHPESLDFFRLAFPELAVSEPPNTVDAKIDWWLERIPPTGKLK
jgi:hypothetical protein